MLNFLLNNGSATIFNLSSAQLRTICELSKNKAEEFNNFILFFFKCIYINGILLTKADFFFLNEFFRF